MPCLMLDSQQMAQNPIRAIAEHRNLPNKWNHPGFGLEAASFPGIAFSQMWIGRFNSPTGFALCQALVSCLADTFNTHSRAFKGAYEASPSCVSLAFLSAKQAIIVLELAPSSCVANDCYGLPLTSPCLLRLRLLDGEKNGKQGYHQKCLAG